MIAFRTSLLLALVASQASAFFVANKASKALVPLQSAYNRNYDNFETNRYSEGGPRRDYSGSYDRSNNMYNNRYSGNRYSEYDRGYNGRAPMGDRGYDRGFGGNDRGYGNRLGSGVYDRGQQGGYDRGYGGYDRGYGAGGYSSRSKFSDWVDGSSNYIPSGVASAGQYDRNYVMDRSQNNGRYNNYNTGRNYNEPGRYSNDRYSADRYNRFESGRYSNNRYGSEYNAGRYGNEYNRGGYSPVSSMNEYNRPNYNMNGRNQDYNNMNGRNQDFNMNGRNREYERTFRSPMDSHIQDYPTYGFDSYRSKWWEKN